MSTGGIAEFLCDTLRPLGPVMAKRMFSGAGLFCDGLMFGLIFGDAQSLAAFEAEGMMPFVYEAKGRQVSLGYWRAPERLLDDPDELVAWARIALAVAQSKARAKAKGGRAPRAARKTSTKPALKSRSPRRA